MPLKYLVCTNFVNICANNTMTCTGNEIYEHECMETLKDTSSSGGDPWGK